MPDTNFPPSEEVAGLVRAGRAAVRVGDYTAALVAFEQAVARDPESREALDGVTDARRRLTMLAPTPTTDAAEFCYRHPDTETGLHCVQCNRPICARCSSPAAVGQLCPECRKGRRSVNYQVGTASSAKAFAAALLTGAAGCYIASFIPFFFLFFLGPSLGEIVLRVVDWATRSKRGRTIQLVVTAGILAGAGLLLALSQLHVIRFNVFSINVLIFLVLSIATAAARLR